jgi:tetratricopeptide (TPR) repeat protein
MLVVALFRRETPARAVVKAQRLMRGAPSDYLSFTERAVKRFPGDAAVRLEHATALCGAGDDRAPREALQYLALEDADDTRRLARAAHTLFKLGEVAAARSCAERAVSIGPTGPTRLVVTNHLNHTLGLIAAHDGNHAEAQRLLRLAHEGNPGDEFIARDLAAAIINDPAYTGSPDATDVIDNTLQTPPGSGCGEQARRMLQGLRAGLGELRQ